MAVKQPIVTDIIPNPLHDYASYTYSWSLWRLDVADYNNLVSCKDVDTAMAWMPGPTSYVVAEDAGMYPDRRLPNSSGLNYQIQDVQLSTTFGLTKTAENSNLLSGSLSILEPYGVTFIDLLVEASWDGQKYNNYTQQPYLLQLDFHGYDDKGQPIPQSATSVFRKRYPIQLLAVKVAVTNKGAEYKLSFAPMGHVAHSEEYGKTPKNFQVKAGTVKEFFDDFTEQFNDYYIREVKDAKAQFGDSIKFDIDPDILNSAIVNPDETSLTHADPNSPDVTLTKSGWAIPAGTSIVKLITKVIAHSSWLINDQLGLEKPKTDTDQTTITNLVKTTVETKLQGVDRNGSPVQSTGVDAMRNVYPKAFTYNIHQYSTWKGSHPAMPSLPSSIPYTIKQYNYLYTGKNIDVLDLKLNFDSTYYTAVMSYTRQLAATQATAQSGADAKLSLAPVLNLIPSSLSLGVPQLNAVGTVTPFRVKNIVNDRNVTTGMNTSVRPAAIVSADVMKSAFSSLNGDMLKVDLSITGDPTLLRQDDWAYSPSPTTSSIYNSWDSLSQFGFAKKYGHIRGDAGELIVTLTINTPIDIDTDFNNNGLSIPLPSTKVSLFSGQYTILKVDSKFASGKFEQTLHLARYINADYDQAFNQSLNNSRSDSTKTSQQNQSESNSTNGSGYDGDNGVNYER